MRIKKTKCLILVSILIVTLLLQMLLLTGLFQYIAPSNKDLVDVQAFVPKHHPRSLSHVQDSEILSVGTLVTTTRAEQVSTTRERLKDEIIAQRKRSKEGREELEKAPKQYGTRNEQSTAAGEEKHQETQNVEHLPQNAGNQFIEFTGVRRAKLRNNGSAKLVGATEAVATQMENRPNPPKKTTDLEEIKNDQSLAEDWEAHQLKVVKSTNKLRKVLAFNNNPMKAYRKSLDMPPEQPLSVANDYITRIQALGKSSNLTQYLKEVCDRGEEPLLECSERKRRPLTAHEEQGRNIMFTLRTTKDYHDTRLGILFETWVTTLYPESLFVVTDGEDVDLAEQLENVGMHYINAKSGHSHNRTDLCCKAGVELELMFQHENEHFDWICHVDDDMYVHVPPLAKQLSKFDPRSDQVYIGRSGSEWDSPRVVNSTTSKLGKDGQRFHFAVGGMYCLSRAMLELAKPYLVGCNAFSDSCSQTQEPEDVTVGLITGAVLKKPLTRTEMIWSHGLQLISSTPSPFLREQIAFSHGFGSHEPWMHLPNVVYVPGALFSIDEDITQFKSIHCHIYPALYWCIDQKRILLENKKKAMKNGKKRECICCWETYMCCEVIKEGYFQTVYAGSQAKLDAKRAELEKKGIHLPMETLTQLKSNSLPNESMKSGLAIKESIDAQLQESLKLLQKKGLPKTLLSEKKKKSHQKVKPGG